jgi:hypothetical protein
MMRIHEYQVWRIQQNKCEMFIVRGLLRRRLVSDETCAYPLQTFSRRRYPVKKELSREKEGMSFDKEGKRVEGPVSKNRDEGDWENIRGMSYNNRPPFDRPF